MHFEDIVFNYITADPRIFAKREFHIDKINAKKGYYIDILAVDYSNNEILICEVTFARKLTLLKDRLRRLDIDYQFLHDFFDRKCGLPRTMNIRPWIFIPQDLAQTFLKTCSLAMRPKITYLEYTVPWKYKYWDRHGEIGKPYPDIPEEFN